AADRACSAHRARYACTSSLLLPPPPRSTLFPYTTLFRSPQDRSFKPSLRLDVANEETRAGSGLRFKVDTRLAAELTPQEDLSLRSEEHTSELQSRENLVCRLLLEKKKPTDTQQAALTSSR